MSVSMLMRAAVVVALFGVVSRFLGLGREMVLAAVYGNSGSADALVNALNIVNVISAILLYVMVTVVIPAFTAEQEREGEASAWSLAWAITGNPLSGSQRGISQIDVEGNIIATTPIVGPLLQRILIGGDRVGNLTLTHLYFLHVGLLPALATALLTFHLWQVYRYGLSGGSTSRTTTPQKYWPQQSVRNMIVLSIVLGTVSILAWKVGAPLEVPADPEIENSPRPEWYLLSLFELRHYFNGPWEIVATLIIPMAVLLFLISVPRIDVACSRRVSAVFRVSVVVLFFGGWSWLTLSSMARDRQDEQFQASEAHLRELSERARMLADRHGVPLEGASALLRNDPKTRGPRLFARHCANCHSHTDESGQGIVAVESSAPNLYGFGTRHWVAGLLDPDKISGPEYFGNTRAAEGDMAGMIHDLFDSASSDEERTELTAQMDAVALALAHEAGYVLVTQLDDAAQTRLNEGRELINTSCIDCHKFHDEGDLGSAPDLTGYGSADWLRGMISDPNGERFYPDDLNDRMPAFHSQPHAASGNMLSEDELNLLIAWLRQEWDEAESR